MESPVKRVALYARVSTAGDRQNLDNQFLELRDYARVMKWAIVSELSDKESGASEERPGLAELMSQAARRLIDVVVVVDLSRLTRGGPMKAFEYIARLTSNQVEFWSVREELFRTSGPAGQLFIALAAHIAEMERENLRARIKAGLARAAANGVKVGRPKPIVDRARVLELKKKGFSLTEIGAKLGFHRTLIHRRLQEWAEEKPSRKKRKESTLASTLAGSTKSRGNKTRVLRGSRKPSKR